MKQNNTSGVSGPGSTYMNMQISPAHLGTGTMRVQRQPTNWKTRSSHFHPMNNTVNSLDATYHTLPATGPNYYPNQEAWTNRSIELAGWSLCGCKDGVPDGQTLFRQWNMFRQMLGQPHILAPTNTGANKGYAPAGMLLVPSLFPGNLGFNVFQATINPDPWWLIVNCGLGLNNPSFQMPAGGGLGLFPPSNPNTQTLFARFPGPKNYPLTYICCCLDDGTPTYSFTQDLQVTT